MVVLLQVLAAYVATSLTVGLLLAVRLGMLIRRADHRREQEVERVALARPPLRRRTSKPSTRRAGLPLQRQVRTAPAR